jgi:predicted DNA-binding transcriptional regulator YafY
MANRTHGDKNIKVRILAIERMLSKERFLTVREIVKKLENQYNIYVDRKTVMDDLMAIDMMIPLEVKHGKKGGYRIMTFE